MDAGIELPKHITLNNNLWSSTPMAYLKTLTFIGFNGYFKKTIIDFTVC